MFIDGTSLRHAYTSHTLSEVRDERRISRSLLGVPSLWEIYVTHTFSEGGLEF